MRRRLDLDQYADALLLALYDSVLSGRDEKITRETLKNFLPSRTENLARLCLERLQARGDVLIEVVVERRLDETGFDKYVKVDVEYVYLSSIGFNRVSNWTDDQYSAAESFSPLGPDGGGVVSLPVYGKVGGGEVPASDRTVTLNHNQPEYLEAIAALDKAIEGFDQDQCLDNELGPEKNALRKSLEVARDFIKLKEINVRVGVALVIEPLQYIAKKYETAIAGAALGQLFRLAVDKILALFN